jgi:serine phosphatase RsbU (regulator of sigma subunit)
VLGDVSGYGPEAAALTGVGRYTVRALADQVLAPSSVLQQLNAAMLRAEPSERFCTAACAEIRPTEDAVGVTVALAGHPAPVVLRDDETIEVLDGHYGAILGAFPDIEVRDQTVDLAPGDAVVFYTDGVIEARHASGAEFGADRLGQVLSTSAGRSADGIARRVERAVLDFRASGAQDDIAVLVVRATAHRPS